LASFHAGRHEVGQASACQSERSSDEASSHRSPDTPPALMTNL
jgi:hypothetical protein